MAQLNDDPVSIGMYSKEVLSSPKSLSAINTTPSDITKDQILQVFLLMYPYISADFIHREDVEKWAAKMLSEFNQKIEDLNAKMDAMASDIKTHNHIHPQGPTTALVTPMTFQTPKLEPWTSKPKDFTFGDNLITSRSGYTSIMDHRNPKQDPSDVSPKVSISTAYNKLIKMTPFDVYGDEIKTGDNGFVNG